MADSDDPIAPSLQTGTPSGANQTPGASSNGDSENERNTDFMNPFSDPINPGKSTFDKVMPAVTGGLAAIVSATPLGPAGGLAVAALGTGIQTLVDSQETTTPIPTPPPSPTYTASTGTPADLSDAMNAAVGTNATVSNE